VTARQNIKRAELGPQDIALPEPVDEAVAGSDCEETKFRQWIYVAAAECGFCEAYHIVKTGIIAMAGIDIDGTGDGPPD
jgi:hypothetical protein